MNAENSSRVKMLNIQGKDPTITERMQLSFLLGLLLINNLLADHDLKKNISVGSVFIFTSQP